MVKLSEVRIGNFLIPAINGSGHEPTKITLEIINAWVKGEDIINWNPVVLTEDILIKCGFTKGPYYHPEGVTYKLKVSRAEISTTSLYPYLWMNGDIVNSNFKYLHQLQNLYFALTGEELNIQL